MHTYILIFRVTYIFQRIERTDVLIKFMETLSKFIIAFILTYILPILSEKWYSFKVKILRIHYFIHDTKWIQLPVRIGIIT